MAEPPPYYVSQRSTMKAYRHCKEYPQKAKGIISFSAFLLSIFIYISIFYIFHLSPSSLLNTTKFWFLISNTLILIISADYGAFSPSKQSQDYLHEEYMVLYSTTSIALPVQEVVSQKNKFIIIPDNKMYSSKQREDLYEKYVLHSTNIVLHVQEVENSEKKKVVSQKSETIPENKLEIVVIKSSPENPSNGVQETMPIETALEDEKKNKTTCCSEETDQKLEEIHCRF